MIVSAAQRLAAEVALPECWPPHDLIEPIPDGFAMTPAIRL